MNNFEQCATLQMIWEPCKILFHYVASYAPSYIVAHINEYSMYYMYMYKVFFFFLFYFCKEALTLSSTDRITLIIDKITDEQILCKTCSFYCPVRYRANCWINMQEFDSINWQLTLTSVAMIFCILYQNLLCQKEIS